MDVVSLIFTLLIFCVLSFIALHTWVFLCDIILKPFKALFKGKKKEIHWNTLDKSQSQKDSETIAQKVDEYHENEKLY